MTSETESPLRVHRFPVTAAVIWSMACQTLRQCIRRRVLLVLFFFLGTILVGSHVMPSHDVVKRLQMLIVLSLYSISFFGIIVAIFLAATVLPEDRRDQTITTVLTKPVGRLNYILGRVLGFSMTLGIILIVMGVVSWGFIRWAGAAAEAETGRKDLLIGKRGVGPNEAYLRGEEPTEENLADARSGVLRGPADRLLVFCFRRELHRLREGDQTLEMTPYVATGAKLPNTDAEIVVENPVTGERLPFGVKLDSGRITSITFPKTLVDDTEGVRVSVRRLLKGTYVRFAPGTLRIMTRPVPFEYSYFKSLVMIFFSFMLVVVISITASTFLSAWVAVLVAFAAYFFAEFQEVLLDLMHSLQGVRVGLFGMAAFAGHHHGPMAEPTPDPLYVVVLNKILYGCMWVLTRIFPNFDRFDTSAFLTTQQDVPAEVVGTAGLILLSYAVCYLVVGHVVFWRKELVP